MEGIPIANVSDLNVKISASTSGLSASLSKAKNLVSGFASSISSGAFLGGFGAMMGGHLVTVAGEMERSHVRLQALVKATGGAAGFTTNEIEKMSGAMARNTEFGAGEMRQAAGLLLTFKSIKGDIFKQAMQAAADLAATGFGSLESAATMLGKSLEDPERGLTALHRVGVSFTQQEREKIKVLIASGHEMKAQGVILDAIKGQVGGVAEAMGNTFLGQLKKMKNNLDKVFLPIGQALVPILRPIVDWVNNVADSMKGWDSTIVPIAAEFGGALKDMLSAVSEIASIFGGLLVDNFMLAGRSWEWFRNAVLVGIWTLQFWFQHWSEYVYLRMLTVQLGAVILGNTLGYWFGTVIPAYLKYFADNWFDIFTGIAVMMGEWQQNMFTSLKTNFTNFWAWLKGGMKGDLKLELPLPDFEKFRNGLKQMNPIAERQIGELETTLLTMVNNLSGKLDKGQEAFLKDKITAWLTKAKGLEKEKLGQGGVGEMKKTETKFAGAAERGSQEAFSIIAKAQVGDAEKVEQRSLMLRGIAAQEKAVEELKALQRMMAPVPVAAIF